MNHSICNPTEVTVALASETLWPPPAPPSLGSGDTLALRSAMARFSNGKEHANRRAAVVSAAERIDLEILAQHARRRTTHWLAAGETDARRIGAVVPVESLAGQLGTKVTDVPAIVEQTELIVQAIGRGQAATRQTDEAARKLLGQFASHPDGPVAAVSLLYQAFDATSALLAVMLLYRHRSRPSALSGTVRVASAPTQIGERLVRRGETVRLEFTSPSQEFGDGLHSCPGRELANTLVTSINAVIANSGYEVEPIDTTNVGDHLPAKLPLRSKK